MTKTTRAELLDFLRTGPKTIPEVAARLGVNHTTAGVKLSRLRDQGVLGVYTVGGAYVYELR